MNYEADHVFPSQFYHNLRKILLESSNMKVLILRITKISSNCAKLTCFLALKFNYFLQPITSSAAYILGEIVASKMEAAQPLVRIMTHHGQIVSIIKALAKWEISKVT